ncbi:hypothetical protein MANES_10G074037v8 [Manihot esculenta]|uniref:Uncharacterized protein n=1 Tax=Manihot esculenta TaxID=3983 RepID=A0ACB7GZ66_MANES|nr:hypothetical protein MANES_10G074037v8 [Manihot esculenta]
MTVFLSLTERFFIFIFVGLLGCFLFYCKNGLALFEYSVHVISGGDKEDQRGLRSATTISKS